MAKPRFYLKDKKAERSPILMRYLYQRRRLKFFPGISIASEDWDDKRGRVRRTARNYIQINAILNKLEIESERIVLESMLSGHIIDPRDLKNELMRIISGKDIKSLTAHDFISDEILNRQQSPQYQERTIQKYKTLMKKVEAYDRRKQIRDLSVDWVLSFISYLSASGLSRNTISKYIKTLKVFLNIAAEKGHISEKVARSKRLSITEQSTKKRFLTIDELEMIRKATLSEALDNVRNLFLLLAFTGQRFSDIEALMDAEIIEINEKEYFKIIQAKTGHIIHIPAHRISKEMLSKDLQLITNQYMNRSLKEVARISGIKNPDEVSTHTARRSAASNMYLMGISSRLICSITGHRSEKMLLRYIQADSLQSAIAVGQVWG